MPFPKVYIVLLNYNGWRDTIECLESLLKLTYPNYSIIVVDNHSLDNSAQHIKAWAEGHEMLSSDPQPLLHHLSNPVALKPLPLSSCEADKQLPGVTADDALLLMHTGANLGFAGGNNVALRYILEKDDAQYVWLLNNDTVVEPDSLSHMVDCYAATNQKVGIVGCKIKYYHHPDRIQCIAGSYYNKWLGYSKQIGNNQIDSGQFDSVSVQPDLINGACMLVSTQFLKTVGLLNEEYFLYFEEQDWAERARVQGFTLAYSNRAVIYHKEGTTIGGGQRKGSTRFSDFYFSRSKLLFTKRYYSWFTTLSVRLSFALTLANRLRHGQFDRIPMILKIIVNPRESRFDENLN